jgi:hypothetical protein
MTREEKENENSYSREKDTGLYEESGRTLELPIYPLGFKDSKWYDSFRVKISDTLYNSFRKVLREGVNL